MSERRNRRKRRQPKMRKMETAVPLRRASIQLPKAAKQRRKRNQRQARLPLQTIRSFVFSARWVSLGLFSLVVYALFLTGMNEQFYLTTIPVDGTFSISANEIVQSSGLAGVHIFAADPNDAAEKLAQIPGVLGATVTLRWPNEVLVQIQEDEPIAVWVEGNTRYWITGNGHIIPARSQSLGLLQIQSDLISSGEDESGQAAAPFVSQELLQGALQLQTLLPQISTLSYRPSSGLSFEDSRGWTVYWGTGTDMQQKLVIYETIVAQLEQQGLLPLYISVSNKEKPYYSAQ